MAIKRRQAVSDLIGQPVFALRVGAKQTGINFLIARRGSCVPQFQCLSSGVHGVFSNPVRRGLSVLKHKVAARLSVFVFHDQKFANSTTLAMRTD